MCAEREFGDAIRSIRAGDERAAAELVRQYEPLIRREVRMHLEDERLRRIFDSMDVVQSVLASFFIRTAAREYDLDNPEQLAGLLMQMAHNKLAARKQYRRRRDARRTERDDASLEWTAGAESSPSEQLESQEILDALRSQLTSEERQIALLRADGCSWAEIAAALGGNAQARRMQLTRGVERAARQLGLEHLYE